MGDPDEGVAGRGKSFHNIGPALKPPPPPFPLLVPCGKTCSGAHRRFYLYKEGRGAEGKCAPSLWGSPASASLFDCHGDSLFKTRALSRAVLHQGGGGVGRGSQKSPPPPRVAETRRLRPLTESGPKNNLTLITGRVWLMSFPAL